MRFVRYLKEDVIKQALNISEPETGRKYSDKLVTKRIDIINQAMKKLEKSVDDEAGEAQMADLEDKRGKWSNVDQETKAPEPVPAAPPEGEEGEEPEEKEAAAAEKEDKDAEKEEKEVEQDEKDQEKEGASAEKEDRDKEKKNRKKENEKDRQFSKKMKQENRLIKSRIKLK